MKYEVTRACGHVETIQIYGSAKEREAKLKWYESTDCKDCYNSIGCEEIKMTYRQYKNEYADCKTKTDSYDAENKTIIVYVPVTEEQETKKPETVFDAFMNECEVDREKAPARLDDVIQELINKGVDLESAKVMLLDFILQVGYIPKNLTLSDVDEIVNTIKTGCKTKELDSVITYRYTDLYLNI